MSYANMDHAGWVQDNIDAHKKYKMTAHDRKAAAVHKGWFAAPDVLDAFQRRAFDILGIVGNGIYNCPIAWDTLEWGNKNHRFIGVPWYGVLATWDFKELTRFVLLCHDARIRGQIAPLGPRHLHITLHERAADGGITRSHPCLAEAVAMHREEIGEQHSICYSRAGDACRGGRGAGAMKFISMWQPWGSLWLSPRKVHETRHWPIKHRGWLGVHAAKKFVRDVDADLQDILDDEFGPHWGLDLPTGALIGMVHIIACKGTEEIGRQYLDADDYHCGDFTPGRFAWQRDEYKVLRTPIPYRGRQSFFDVPDALVQEAA